MASFLRIYADAEGESHFDDLDVAFEEAEFVPPAPPVLMSRPQAASAYSVEQVRPGWHGDLASGPTASGRRLPVGLRRNDGDRW